MIRTEKLNKRFGKERGVFDLNMEIDKCSIYGFIGPNGAGKTTTIKLLCGLLKPDGGKAFIDGIQVLPKNISAIKKKIGYMPDITGVYEQMSVWEFLDFYGAAFKLPPKRRKKRIEEVLEITNSTHMIDYQMTSLSRGMRQRIGLAKTLVHDPAILILDEPAGGLDPNARIEMRQTIARLKELGKTILLSSHILPELASICDKVGIIYKGKLLVQGTVKEIGQQLQENLVVNVTVDSGADYAKQYLERIDGVENVKVLDQSQLKFTFNGTRNEISSIIKCLVKNEIPVRWFSENEADLENVFMGITGKEDAPARG
ncbi:MAG: ABC transporter ATP-binding protein [Victivallales bacterium]|nr:ABC transporter ATP-binding protein [Victivallales bacterium]